MNRLSETSYESVSKITRPSSHQEAVARENTDRIRNVQAGDVDKQTVSLGQQIIKAADDFLRGKVDQKTLVELHTQFGQLDIIDRKGDLQAISDDGNFIKGDQAIIDSEKKILKSGPINDVEKQLRQDDIEAHQKSRDNSSADIPNEIGYIRADNADLRINAAIASAGQITPELLAKDIDSKQKIISMRQQDIADEPQYNVDNQRAIELDNKVVKADKDRIGSLRGRDVP